MSKDALKRLADEIKGDSKNYRKQTLYKQGHIVDLRATLISSELREEISRVQPELLDNVLTDEDIRKAASEFRRVFTGLIGSKNINGNIASQPTYDTMQRKLAAANKAALTYLNNIVQGKTGKITQLKADRIIQLDHVRTAAETRYAQAFSNNIQDPLETLKALRNNPFISRKVFDKVSENIIEISSYYKNNNKIFELTGKVSVQLRSGTANQDEGRKEVNERISILKKAINDAVKSTDWPTQAASDSYKDFITKKLINSAIAAGGTGKKTTINKASSKVRDFEKTIEKVVEYSTSRTNSITKKKSRFTLRNFVAYINSRLPETIRKNMGSPALNYKTGRFANSARVLSQDSTEQGFLRFNYTYMRSPYDVFDPILGKLPWNTPGRDPKKLVDKSIREIAQELSIGRFYIRRA